MKKTFMILDLDDTIYPIRSIPQHTASIFFDTLRKVNNVLDEPTLSKAIEDSWTVPFYELCQSYGFSQEMIEASIASFERIKLEIVPFQDYTEIRSSPIKKFLVTSGVTTFQQKKIEALGIRNDFQSIHINDPLTGWHSGKRGLFLHILGENDLHPEEGLVIGDNIDSELHAARELRIDSVLIDREKRYAKIPPWVSHVMNDFSALKKELL